MNNPDLDPERLKKLTELNKLIHEPGRLAIMSFLFVVKEADFVFLLDQTSLTRGNLSSHMAKLEGAGYVEISKEFVEKLPRTTYKLTDDGEDAFKKYRHGLLDSLGGF